MASMTFIEAVSQNYDFSTLFFTEPCAAGNHAINNTGIYWCPNQVIYTSLGDRRCHLFGYERPTDYGGNVETYDGSIKATTPYQGMGDQLSTVNLEDLVGALFYKNDTTGTLYASIKETEGYTHDVTAGTGGTVSGGGGDSIRYNGSDYYYSGTRTYTASANANYVFDGWAVSEGSGTESGATITVNCSSGEFSAKAIFRKKPKLTYDSAGGSAPPQSVYGESGTIDSMTVSRDGYVFKGWLLNGTLLQPGDAYSISEDSTAYAQWGALHSITVESSVPDGISFSPSLHIVYLKDQYGDWEPQQPGVTVETGKDVKVVAQTTNLDGYHVEFERLSSENITIQDESSAEIEFVMPDSDVRILVHYKKKQYSVSTQVHSDSVEVGAVGQEEAYITDIDGVAKITFEYGDTAVFHSPEPEDGFYFAGWYAGEAQNVLVSTSASYVLSAIDGNISLTARYGRHVTIRKREEGGNGKIRINWTEDHDNWSELSVPVVIGIVTVVQAVPYSGSGFYGWEKNGSPIDDENVYLDGMSDDVYTAVFSETPPEVTVTCKSWRNDPESTGDIGTLGVSGKTLDDDGRCSVSGFSYITLVPQQSQSDGALRLFRVVEIVDNGDWRTIESPYTVRVAKEPKTFLALWGAGTPMFTVFADSEDEEFGRAGFIGPQDVMFHEESFTRDTVVTVVAEANNGYRFVGWEEDDGIVSTSASYTFTVNLERRLVAKFAKDNAIYEWEGSDENKSMEWTSKTFVMPRPFDPVAARVDARAYGSDGSLQLSVGTFSSPAAAAKQDHKKPITILSQDGRRLPRTRPERFVSFTVTASEEVDAVVIGTNMAEVN